MEHQSRSPSCLPLHLPYPPQHPVLRHNPGQTITAARYVQTLHKLRRAFRDKRPGRNIIILHDDARLTSEAIAKMRWEFLPRPSYSPDLAPSDYNLFGFVKDQLRGQRYETTETIQKAVRQCLWMAGTKRWQLCGKIKKGL